MPRATRLLSYLGVVAGLSILLLTLPYVRQTSPSSFLPSSLQYTTPQEQEQPAKPRPGHIISSAEKYFSWFPHGDFAEQHEAFRNAIRIAYDTNRTLIAPQLRLGKPYDWLPFHDLARRYEAQDKTFLRSLCSSAAQLTEESWRTELEPCATINDFTEVPWSSVFDLKPLQTQFGIRIIERVHGHGWGENESALLSSNIRESVIIVDPMTFPTNGSEIDPNAEPAEAPPLKRYLRAPQLKELDGFGYIQFGALSSAGRIRTRNTAGQSALHRALTRSVFVTPQPTIPGLSAVAKQIMHALGGLGRYSSLHLNLAQFMALDGRSDRLEDNGQELMDAVVLEVFGDIPINQAVAAAMPILQPSRLAEIMNGPQQDRRQLLDACVEYRREVDSRYPVYYLVNDLVLDPKARPDIFGPLMQFFPCVFTRRDMADWHIIDSHWPTDDPFYDRDPDADYNTLLTPLLDMTLATRAYSFFEIPQTMLTRFMSWQPKPIRLA
ncbi:hypothetical protein BCR43DRAFT_525972 [Syncephalastrum racemosum]|uniref:Uncharacterized protein n=1 Tax=Syncephalastrum racemosum TaxID=13706 RepID=A0A1X2H9S9_SYNRA|nr:hypothetical protein BCR43DRAFT_525972 [Syncephalastrum racemosum]